MEIDEISTLASRWRMLWPLRTPRGSFIATSSRPIFLSRRAARPRFSISAWRNRCANRDRARPRLEDSLTAVGHNSGNRGLHVSRAGARRGVGPAQRSVLAGRRAVRDGDGQETVCHGQRDHHAGRGAESEARLPAAVLIPPFLPISRASSAAPWRRTADTVIPNALAMKGDLQSLRKETESGLTKSGARRPALPYRMATTTFPDTSKFSTYLLLGISAVAAYGFDRGGGMVVQRAGDDGRAARRRIRSRCYRCRT
jgi:hypothetical protein